MTNDNVDGVLGLSKFGRIRQRLFLNLIVLLCVQLSLRRRLTRSNVHACRVKRENDVPIFHIFDNFIGFPFHDFVSFGTQWNKIIAN